MPTEPLELKPWDRKDYPNLKSRSELTKLNLMPAPGTGYAARVERPKKYGGNYRLYDLEKTVPLVLTPAQQLRQDRKIERAERIQTCKELLQKQREDAAAYLSTLNPEKKYSVVVIDFETTGFWPEWDEILQVAIVDQDGNELMNERCSPVLKTTWRKAETVHGITPEDVAGKKSFGELAPKVAEILLSSEAVIAYNDSFERGFLTVAGLNPKRFTWADDPMIVFADVHNDGRWAKLINAAAYYGYQFHAHDALEDVRATLHVHKHLQQELSQNT